MCDVGSSFCDWREGGDEGDFGGGIAAEVLCEPWVSDGSDASASGGIWVWGDGSMSDQSEILRPGECQKVSVDAVLAQRSADEKRLAKLLIEEEKLRPQSWHGVVAKESAQEDRFPERMVQLSEEEELRVMNLVAAKKLRRGVEWSGTFPHGAGQAHSLSDLAAANGEKAPSFAHLGVASPTRPLTTHDRFDRVVVRDTTGMPRWVWRFGRRPLLAFGRALINRGHERGILDSYRFHSMHALLERVFCDE